MFNQDICPQGERKPWAHVEPNHISPAAMIAWVGSTMGGASRVTFLEGLSGLTRTQRLWLQYLTANLNRRKPLVRSCGMMLSNTTSSEAPVSSSRFIANTQGSLRIEDNLGYPSERWASYGQTIEHPGRRGERGMTTPKP